MKSVITKEQISKVSADSKNSDTTLTPFDFSEYVAVGIGAIAIIRAASGESYLYVGENVKKDYLKEWNKDVGKLFSRDMHKNNTAPYFQLTTPTYKVILRRIEEDRLEEMEILGFKHVEIGDYFYTIIKEVANGESWRSTERVEEDLDDVDTSTEEEEDEPIEEEESLESISLFD